METDFPEGDSATATFTLDAPKEFTLAFRRPAWAGEGFRVAVNGEAIADLPEPGTYVEIKRTWKTGDKVELTLPKQLHLAPLPDNPQRVAVMWGPLVLAGDLGPGRERGRGRGRGQRDREQPSAPVFVAAEQPVNEWVATGAGRRGHVPHRRASAATATSTSCRFTGCIAGSTPRIGICSRPRSGPSAKQQIAAERERLRKLEEATVAFFQPGQMQAERDVNFESEEAYADSRSGPCRAASAATGSHSSCPSIPSSRWFWL